MKKSFRLMNAAVMVAGLSFAFTACNPETEVRTGVITFEDVAFDSTGFFNGSNLSGTMVSYESWGSVIHSYTGSFSSGILSCPNVFYQNQTYLSTWWSGMACSNHNDKDSVGYGNQYSVYAGSGAAGSKNFGLVGSDGTLCSFEMPVTVKSMMINNSTYDYWALKDGNDGNGDYGLVRKFAAGDYFNVTVIGYDSLNVKTDSVVIPLAEFRNAQSYICSNWTKVSLEQLGDQVKMIGFKFDSSDKSGIWLNTPTYVCIDNIIYDIK